MNTILMKDLALNFSKDELNTTDQLTIFDINSVKTIYSVVNKHLFEDSLKMPSIEIALQFHNTKHIAGYNYRYILLQNSSTYTLVTNPTKIQSGKILMPPRILINPDIISIGKINLMFAVNVLAHEMIHQFDIEQGTYLQELYSLKKEFQNPPKDKIEELKHGKVFKAMMKRANDEFGLNVEVETKSLSDNIETSFEKIKELVRENLVEIKNKLDESDLAISDVEMLRRSIEITKYDEFTAYLGNGAFESTVF